MDSKKPSKKPLIIAVGAGLAAAALAGWYWTGSTQSPFEATPVSANETVINGQVAPSNGEQASEPADGQCGTGKCAADRPGEGKCGAGKCGADLMKEQAAEKANPAEEIPAPAEEAPVPADGQCGTGKCGPATE